MLRAVSVCVVRVSAACPGRGNAEGCVSVCYVCMCCLPKEAKRLRAV
jgi:hypothetical protein